MFILFGSFFSTYVTNLHPIQNRDVSRDTAKSKELFVTKVNGFQLPCLFSSTLIFSKFSGILTTECRHNEIYDGTTLSELNSFNGIFLG